ncbi:hypothetical protein BASA81_011096 [Batrachochytrium salamandrivorans]|nr:hypothetical protein BASA81_011096 [Batrachochytrium salamandrivorans]
MSQVPVKFMKDIPTKSKTAEDKIKSSELPQLLAKLGEEVSSLRAQDLAKEVGADGQLLSLSDALQILLNLRKAKPVNFGQQVSKKPQQYTAKTVESESGAKHTYSEEEAVAFSNHINQTLRGDVRLQDRLPLGSAEDLFSAVEDGLLLIKLINKAVPDTVDERATNSKQGLNIFQKNENQNLVVNAAKAIGCKVVNIHNEDLISGKPHLVLGLVWQIVRIQLLSQISLKNHPELVRLLEDGEELSDLLKLPADQLLLRWINFHLKNAGETRRVSNFGEDLRDSHAYTVLLNQIDSSKCDKRALQQTDLMERAESVIVNSQNLGVESFIRPENIASGNARLNLAFCAQIFNTNPGLVATEEELTDMAGLVDDDQGDTREERVFRMWINSLGIEDLYVNNLFEDLRDGVVLLQLYDRIEPGSVVWKQVNRPPKNKYKKMENCNYVVVLGKNQTFGFSLVNVGGVDIADGNKKLILSIVWQMMRMHSLIVLSSLLAGGQKAKEADVINWANSHVGGGLKAQSFKDKHLGNSQYFLALCNALAPGVVDKDIVLPGDTAEEQESNAKYVISIARKLGACVFLTWEDIVEVKSKMLFTFTASLMAWWQEKKGQAPSGRRGSLLGNEPTPVVAPVAAAAAPAPTAAAPAKFASTKRAADFASGGPATKTAPPQSRAVGGVAARYMAAVAASAAPVVSAPIVLPVAAAPVVVAVEEEEQAPVAEEEKAPVAEEEQAPVSEEVEEQVAEDDQSAEATEQEWA